jgi:hypothetical protein
MLLVQNVANASGITLLVPLIYPGKVEADVNT